MACKTAVIERNVAHLVLPDEVQIEPSDAEPGGPLGRVASRQISPPVETLAAAVEMIRAGDAVWTLRDPAAIVSWVGRQKVDATGDLAPVVFAPGAIGNAYELAVSPNHRMRIEGWQVELLFAQDAVLVPAKHLVGFPGVSRQPTTSVEYCHVMFDRHETVEANGALSESFFPGPMALAGCDTATRDELLAIFPELADRPDLYGPTAARCITARESSVLMSMFDAAA